MYSFQESDRQRPCGAGFLELADNVDCVKQVYDLCKEGTWRAQNGECLNNDEWISYCTDSVSACATIYSVNNYYPATKLGGIYWNHHVCPSVCPSVRPSLRLSSAFGFPAHNYFLFTPIIMKLHMQTPHESRMCPVDFEVKRSKVSLCLL